MSDQNPRGRATVFGSAAADYARLRPAPCAAAVDWAVPEGCRRVLDLAAGAGTLTARLARRVPEVVAVEPDERMRAVLAERNPGVRALRGTAEELPLPDGELDAVVVSSAWHWFDPERAVAEIARVLRPGGRLSVLWHGMDSRVPWVWEWRSRLRTSPPAAGGDEDEQARAAAREEHSWRSERLHELLSAADSPFGQVERGDFTCAHRASPRDTAGLLGTYSRVLLLPEDERRRLLDRAEDTLRELHGLGPEGGRIELPFRSRCHRAARRA